MASTVYRLLTAFIILTGCHGSKLPEGGLFIEDILHIWNEQAFRESAASIYNISDVCQQDLTDLFSGDPRLLQVIDSFGKLPSGLLYYNVDWVGNFDECMEINNFRHCLVDMDLNVTMTLNNTSDPSDDHMKMTFPVYRLLSVFIIFTGCHGNKFPGGSASIGDLSHIWNDRPIRESATTIYNISDVCQQDLSDLFEGDPRLLQVIDSFGKLPSGLLYYNLDWVGYFDECMEINNFRHCLVDMDLNVTVAQNSTLTFPVSWGVCAPISCSQDDVQRSVEFYLDSLNVTWFGVRDGSTVYCAEKRIFNGGFIGTCILLGILSLLTLVGTGLDHYITQKEQQKSHDGGQGSGQGSMFVSESMAQMQHTMEEERMKLGQSSENVPNIIIEETTVSDGPISDHTCTDGLGQGTNDESNLIRIDGYGGTQQNGGTNFEGKPVADEIPKSAEAASETTSLLGASSSDTITVVHKKKFKDKGWIQLLMSFSLYRNLHMILSSKHTAGSIACLHGIRVLSITWVILIHVLNTIHHAGLEDNFLQFVQKSSQKFEAQVYQVNLTVDTFFMLGGVLLSYVTLKKMKDKNGKVGWGWLYLHRYVRLTPVLAVVILLHTFILPYMMRGPISHRYESRVELCKAWWWTDLLYIDNFVPKYLGDQCIYWAWYLANDMQFFILSPLFLIPIYRYGVKGTIVLIITCLASFIITAVLVFQNDFHALEIDNSSRYFEQIYPKPYCRVPPYLLGLALGYVMRYIGNGRIKLYPVIVAVGWSCAIALGITVVYGLYDVTRGAIVLSTAANVMFITFSRFAWALAVSWVVFACHYGYGGLVNDFLCWNFWVPLGRLSYATYLVHPLVIFVFAYNMATPLHWSAITMSYLYAAFILLSFCCALLMCVLVEFPFGNLEKQLQKIVQGMK